MKGYEAIGDFEGSKPQGMQELPYVMTRISVKHKIEKRGNVHELKANFEVERNERKKIDDRHGLEHPFESRKQMNTLE